MSVGGVEGGGGVFFLPKSAARTMSTFAELHCVLGCGAEQQAVKIL